MVSATFDLRQTLYPVDRGGMQPTDHIETLLLAAVLASLCNDEFASRHLLNRVEHVEHHYAVLSSCVRAGCPCRSVPLWPDDAAWIERAGEMIAAVFALLGFVRAQSCASDFPRPRSVAGHTLARVA